MSADDSYFGRQSEWFDPTRVVRSIDARAVGPETMPLTKVMEEAKELQRGGTAPLSCPSVVESLPLRRHTRPPTRQ